ncbi:MAG: hypothetical protein ACKVU2_16320 [Saprospiraceae bacterium]
MVKKLLALSCLLMVAFALKAQVPPPCNSNQDPPADFCSDICIYCNFNGMMGTTAPYTPQTPPGGFCSGIQNEQWLGFIAGSTAATFTVTPANCQNGNGLQIALYSSCDGPPIDCNGGQQGGGTTPMSITVTNMVPGVNYYLLIDGYGGDICDFTVTVVPPIAVQGPNVGATGAIQGPTTVCPGATVTYSIPATSGAGAYIWNGPPGSLINGNPPPVTLPAPGGNIVQVTMGPNSGQICVMPVNSCDEGNEVCKNIIAQPIPPTSLTPVTVCAEDVPYTLPWGDQVSNSGLYENTFMSYQGCDSIVRQNVTVKAPIIRFLPPQSICAGTCITICGEDYCDPGSFTHTCQSFQGCDSVINFSINVVTPVADIIPGGVITCINDTIILGSAPSQGTKVWRNAQGVVLGTGNSVAISQPGTIILTVTASAGVNLCTAMDTITVTANITPPVVTATGGFLGCGNSQAQLTSSTNAPSATYQWGPPDGLSATNIPNPIAALPGVFTVTVTNSSNGCSGTASVTVTGNTDPPLATATGSTITCTANPVSITSSTDVQNPTFSWSGPLGFTSNQQNNAVGNSGTYTVTITNTANNCSATATAVVSLNTTVPGASASGGVIGCTTPIVILNGNSPTGGVTYGWTGPGAFSANTPNPPADVAGQYTVTVTDPTNGCTSTATANVTGNTDPPTVSATGGTVSCGDPNLDLDGGSTTNGVTFSWSGPNSFTSVEEDPTVLAPGIYTLTVTGPNTCTATAEATVLGDFGTPNAAATGGIITCSSSSTTINGTSTTPGVTFKWTAPNGDNIPGANPIVSNTGVYTLIVTALNGCTTTATAEVVPDANVPNASAAGGTLNCLVFDITLNGGSTTPGVTFEWNGPNGFTSLLEDPLVTQPGTYTFVVTNSANGCSAVANAIVELDDIAPGASASGGTVSCADPDIDLMGDSPTNGVTWAWSGPNNFTSTDQEPSVSVDGVYNLVVTGPNGCASTSSATVIADQALPIPTSTTGTLTCSTTDIFLNGGANVSATWAWSGPNGFSSTDEDPSVSVPGDYTLVATAVNGCVDSVTVTVAQDITPPDISASGNTISCTNPQVPLSGASATLGATFQWFGPGFTSMQPNPIVDGNGAYTLIVTAPNGCTSEATVDVLLDTDAPVAFAASPDVLTCSLLAAQIATTANNANSPITTYVWTGPGGFESFDEDPTVALPGLYNLVVTSQNGCTTTASVTVVQDVVVPNVSAVGNTLTCVITSVDLNGESTTTGASYQWSGPGNFTSTLPDPTVTVAGNYILIVTAPNGCTASATAPVILDAVFPDATAVSSNNLDCDDLSTTLDGTSNAQGVTFAWSDQTGNIFGVTENVIVSNPGTYQFAVTAPNGCVTQAFVLVTQDILAPGAFATGDTIDCTSGQAPLLGSTQAQNVNWLWEGPGGLNSTDQNPVVSQAGVYTLTVTGANACTSTATATIVANTLSPEVLVGGADILTCTLTELTLTSQIINPPGAIGVWTDPTGATISSAANVLVSLPGDYLYTVTAPNGCITASTLTVGQDIETPQDVVVNGGLINCTTPTISLSASSSTFNVTYSWTGPGGFTSNLKNPTVNAAGTYTVLLTNTDNGCQATAVTFVTGDFAQPSVTATAPVITCSAPTSIITATGTPANVTYRWAGAGINVNNQSVKNPTVATAGTYTVTVTAANGCTGTTTVSVTADVTNPNATATGVTLTCTQPTSTITGASTTPNVTYSWTGPGTFTANVPSPTVSIPGLYILTVTASNGCTTTATTTVVPDSNAPTANASSGTLTCSVTSLPLMGSSNLATVSWQWSGPNGFSATTQNAPATVPGLYTLIVTNPQNGCTATATTTVQSDTQGPQVSIAAPDQLNCSVTQVMLSASVQQPGNYVYEWGGSGTIISGGLSPSPTVGSAGSYTVTVTNQNNGCSSTQSTAVTVDSSAVSGANLQVKNVSCFGRTDGGLNVASVVGGTAPFLYSLDNAPFSAQSVFGSLPPGSHEVAIQDANGCEWTTTFEVLEPEELLVELGPDTTVYLGDSLLLTIDDVVNFPNRVATRILEPAYLDTVFGAYFQPASSFRYVLTVLDSNGCRATDTRLVLLDKTRFVYIPNVFDPGASDVDALFFISARESQVRKIRSFKAYDRWGNVMFERYNFLPDVPGEGWDGTVRGTKAPPAVYTYFAEIEFVDNEVVLYKGDVTLLRN